jgi:hypothetical protein
MIIVKLKGGLGNQLFQYAMARRVAHSNNTILKLDIESGLGVIEGATTRYYGLHSFNITENFASAEEIGKLKKGRIYNLLIEEFKPYHWRSYVKERQFNFNPEILKISDNTYIEGYWQSEKYFNNIESKIRKEITLKVSMADKYRELMDSIAKTDSISIHIRRGDYITDKRSNRVIGNCPLDYYYAAVEKISLSIASPHFFVFSDDIKWAEENLKGQYPLTFVSDSQNNDYEELILMSKCKHQIIANSSFSWWGAWLNNNPSKIVVAPKKWFNNPYINTNDLIPEPWIKI